MRGITEKQQAVLDFIRGFIRENRMPPTQLEIAEAMGWASVNSASEVITALERKGVLSRKHGSVRGIVLTDSATVDIPATGDPEYWFDGVFQHQRYERDVYKAIEAVGMKGSIKTWGGKNGD